MRKNRTTEIVSLLKRQDQKGLTMLYADYADAVYGLIVNIVKDTPASEDVLQQTFLKIWNSIDQYDVSKSGFFTWIAAIARNTSIDQIRLKNFQRNQKELSLSNVSGVSDSVSVNGNKIDVENLLGKLDTKYKLVLDKIYLEGMTHSQVAKALDLPLGTVKSRLRMGIMVLREELKGEKDFFISSILPLSLLNKLR